MSESSANTPGGLAASSLGIPFTEIAYGKVSSVEEAAAARGVSVAAVVKSLLVRRGEGDYLLVLIPGDRSISWPKLRGLLGVSRLSMPNADAAFEVTGYKRGTITPLGVDLPVVLDERVSGHVTLGSGSPGVAIGLETDDLVAAFAPTVADVSE